jgi:hypothetical protein
LFLFFQEIEKVVVEIGPEHIVHVVTDNGANYKKACHRLGELYEHITWTPCLAHTVNLMLKDIAERYDHSATIKQCKQISSWLHNHGQLNTMMRNAIGGELVKWNATRFGTNYMFLDSIYRKREQFLQWVSSPDFLNSKWADTVDGRFMQTRFSCIEWWEALKYIIDTVQPVYKFLRFADQDKRPNLCDVVMEFQTMKAEMESFFGRNTSTWNEYNKILEARIRDVYIGTYVGAGMHVRLYQLYVLHFKTIDFVLN